MLVPFESGNAGSTLGWKIANPPAPVISGQAPFTTGEVAYSAASTGFGHHADLGLATAFQLSDITSFQAYQVMYDAYKINKVTLNVEWLNAGSAAELQPTIWMYYDQDDQGVPTTATRLVGKQGVRKHTFGTDRRNTVSFSFTPTVQQSLTGGGGTQPALVAAKPTWLNCTFPSVPHQALKLWITDVPTRLTTDDIVQAAFRLNFTYHVSFRSPILAF